MKLADNEDKTQRRTAFQLTAIKYRRVYNITPEMMESATGLIEGDPMPGETDAGLGPFIERGGIGWQKQGKGGAEQLVLSCILLRKRQ
jgi:hypothetical protein